ncbi:cyclin-Q [Parasteatoda tepidariorum]|uniref:cyclin-Q n=1 Tax=Parasteatoda tepidariorum TaxID=114398 RepID=UPI00077F9C3C|nr:uncharacterized protein LOC107443738 [Parasteatoda tepidariorum]
MLESFIPDKAILLIESAGKRLALASNTIARAMHIYHQFKRCIDTIDFEDGLVAASAIALSAKTNEDTLDLQNIVIVFWDMLNKDQVSLPKLNSEEFQELTDSLTKVQYLICRALKFELNHLLAHQYVIPFLRNLHEIAEFQHKWDVFVNIVWKVVSTAYMSKKCLNYDACEIAVASIYITCQFCRIKTDVITNWPEALSATMKKEKLYAAIVEFLAVCGVISVPNEI